MVVGGVVEIENTSVCAFFPEWGGLSQGPTPVGPFENSWFFSVKFRCWLGFCKVFFFNCIDNWASSPKRVVYLALLLS